MKHTVQMMDNDFNTVEFVIEEAKDGKDAIQQAFVGIDPEDVCMVAVFQDGCNISLPIEPVDRVYLKREDDKPAEYYEAGGMEQ